MKNIHILMLYHWKKKIIKKKKLKKKPQSEYKQMSKKLFPPHKKPFPKSFVLLFNKKKKEEGKIRLQKMYFSWLQLTQLPERLGSELPNEGLALMRIKFDVSSSRVDGKPKLSLLLDLVSAKSSESLDRLSLKFLGSDEKTSAFNSALLSSSESDCKKIYNLHKQCCLLGHLIIKK